MSQKLSLLIIDPQIDFCDPQGALYVPHAEEDMRRLAAFIRQQKQQIESIHVTLDSHHLVHIAHPIFWQDAEGKNPPPFTTITASEVELGRWKTANPSFQIEGFQYVRRLEKNGRYSLTIWPPHCLIGSRGHAVHPELFAALLEWENEFHTVNYWTKGSYFLTEHFSALKADVQFPSVPETMLNKKLLQQIEQSDLILIAGEARTHCVASTVRDLAYHFADTDSIHKMVLLTDAMSDIPGFEKHAVDFMHEMKVHGCKTSTTKNFQFNPESPKPSKDKLFELIETDEFKTLTEHLKTLNSTGNVELTFTAHLINLLQDYLSEEQIFFELYFHVDNFEFTEEINRTQMEETVQMVIHNYQRFLGNETEPLIDNKSLWTLVSAVLPDGITRIVEVGSNVPFFNIFQGCTFLIFSHSRCLVLIVNTSP